MKQTSFRFKKTLSENSEYRTMRAKIDHAKKAIGRLETRTLKWQAKLETVLLELQEFKSMREYKT